MESSNGWDRQRAGSEEPVPIFLSSTSESDLLEAIESLKEEFNNSNKDFGTFARMVSERQDQSLGFRLAAILKDTEALNGLTGADITCIQAKAAVVYVLGEEFIAPPNSIKQLYMSCDAFKKHLDACHAICKELTLGSMIPNIFESEPAEEGLPLLYSAVAMQIATVKTWIQHGLKPDLLLGYGAGRFVALHIADILSLEDVFRTIGYYYCTSDQFRQYDPAALEVTCTSEEIQSLVHSCNSSEFIRVKVTQLNAPQKYVVEGNRRSIDQFELHCGAFSSRRQPLGPIRQYTPSIALGDDPGSNVPPVTLNRPTISVELCFEDEYPSQMTQERFIKFMSEPIYFDKAMRRIMPHFANAVWLTSDISNYLGSLLRDTIGRVSPQNHLLSTALEADEVLETSMQLWRSGSDAISWSFATGLPHRARSTPDQNPTASDTNMENENVYDSAYESQGPDNTPLESRKIFTKLCQVLSDITGIPTLSISGDSQLQEMGLKSALANTVLSEVQEVFQVNIEKEVRQSCNTIQDVVDCIGQAIKEVEASNKVVKEQIKSTQSDSTPERLLSQETVVFKTVDGLDLEADIFYPPHLADPTRPLPVALMIHGGGHVMLSRHDTRPQQTARLLQDGFLPITIDYRLCPEINIKDGPMTDVVDAVSWIRDALPSTKLLRPDVRADGDQVVAIGWSTGGTLVMSLGFNCIARGVRPPEASLVFYCPLDYEDPFWMTPNIPIGSEFANSSFELDELIGDGLSEKPILKYNVNPAKRAVGGWMSATDGRSRLVLYMNWHGRALHVLLNGLNKADLKEPPTPTEEDIISISPLAQIRLGNYHTPTFLIHSQDDDLVPWQQAHSVWQGLQKRGVESELRIIDDAPHLFDLYTRYNKRPDLAHAVKEGYDFLLSHIKK